MAPRKSRRQLTVGINVCLSPGATQACSLSPPTNQPATLSPSTPQPTRSARGRTACVRVDGGVFAQSSTRVFVSVRAGYCRGHQDPDVPTTATLSVAWKSISPPIQNEALHF